VSEITFLMFAQSQKIGKPNNLNILGSKETERYKQDICLNRERGYK